MQAKNIGKITKKFPPIHKFLIFLHHFKLIYLDPLTTKIFFDQLTRSRDFNQYKNFLGQQKIKTFTLKNIDLSSRKN